ncbi:TPA: hypothetical protein HA238_03200 [Candidatus Micrarchaeota archaeon]|nr:hypothetical protein [Candidatus Micrarchaeota archaeon]
MAYVNITVERHVDTVGRMRLFCAKEPLITSGRIEHQTAGELIRRAIEIDCGRLPPEKLREQIRRLEITGSGEFSSKDELTAIADTLTSRSGFMLQAANLLIEHRLDDSPRDCLYVDVETIIPVQLDDRMKDMNTWNVYASRIGGNHSCPHKVSERIRYEAGRSLDSWNTRIDQTESRLLEVRLSLGRDR